MEKGKQEALKQGAESAKAAQKHIGKERQSARRAQEVLRTRGDREATEGKKGQRDRGCGNIEKAVMAEAHCCFIFFV